MNLPLILRPRVKSEVQEAHSWYERERAGLGDDFAAAVEEALQRVDDAADSYPPVYRDVRMVLVRRFPYAVYYRIRSDHVAVIAIMHTSRNPRSWQRRR